jgi:hypothetical protein
MNDPKPDPETAVSVTTGEKPRPKPKPKPKEDSTPAPRPPPPKPLPHDVPAEKGVLSSILRAPGDAIPKCVAAGLGSLWFYVPAHKTIYIELLDMWDSGGGIDLITFTNRLRDKKLLDEVGGAGAVTDVQGYLTEIFNYEKIENLPYYIDIVRDNYLRRQIIAGAEVDARRAQDALPNADIGAMLDEISSRAVSLRSLHGRNGTQIHGYSMVHYSREEIDKSQNVLGNHWCERERGVLVTGPSGIGKSTAVYQMTASWACGEVSFGIAPLPGGLRIVAVQTEDSYNDLIEMSRCVDRLSLSPAQLELVERNTHIETINDAVGRNFIDKLDSLLQQKPCDLIILNPISDFIPGELTDEKEVKYFLRQLLNPLLAKHHCGGLCVQPTPKTNRDSTEKYSWFDWMYWGAGSAEFARWARGGIVIVPTPIRGTYRFIAAKRYEKLGWLTPEYWYAHSLENDVCLWVPATDEQIALCKKAKDHKPEDLHALFPSEKELLRDDVRLLGKERLGIGYHTTDGFLTILVSHDWIHLREYPRAKKRPEVRFFKNETPSQELR